METLARSSRPESRGGGGAGAVGGYASVPNSELVEAQQQETLRERNLRKIEWYWRQLGFPRSECEKMREGVLAGRSVKKLKSQNGYLLLLEEFFQKKEKALYAVQARDSTLRWLGNQLERGGLDCAAFELKVVKTLRLLRKENLHICVLLEQLRALKSRSLAWLPPPDDVLERHLRGLQLSSKFQHNQYLKRLRLFVRSFQFFEPLSSRPRLTPPRLRDRHSRGPGPGPAATPRGLVLLAHCPEPPGPGPGHSRPHRAHGGGAELGVLRASAGRVTH